MRLLQPQIDSPDYMTMEYLSRERWISFWYQLMEVAKTRSASVLEIGPGPKIVTRILKSMRMRLTTVDIDFRLRPTVRGDVTKLPFADNAFDCVLAAEILEHIPFSEVAEALKELARVSRAFVVITLPHFSHFAPSIAFKIFPYVPRFSRVFPVSLPVKHKFDGQHYWEIGKSGFSISLIRKLLAKHTGMKLVRDYLIEENPFHHVFVLQKFKKIEPEKNSP